MPPAGPLGSTGITPLPRYYGPICQALAFAALHLLGSRGYLASTVFLHEARSPSLFPFSGGARAKESDPAEYVDYENCKVYCGNGNQANIHASSLQECTNFAYQLCGGPYQDGQFSYNGAWYAW